MAWVRGSWPGKGFKGVARGLVTSKPFTSAAMRTGQGAASNRVMGPTPDSPATTRFQLSSTLSPSGLAVPNPVTTTLLFGMSDPFCLERQTKPPFNHQGHQVHQE